MDPSYTELTEENQRLRVALSLLSDSSCLTADSKQVRLVGSHEERLYKLLRSGPRRERIYGISQVLFPSQACSTALLLHGARWTSWLHGAVDQDIFENEVISFYSASDTGRFEQLTDPSRQAWLGMFFAYITVSFSYPSYGSSCGRVKAVPLTKC